MDADRDPHLRLVLPHELGQGALIPLARPPQKGREILRRLGHTSSKPVPTDEPTGCVGRGRTA
jgi:hypothetical protein